MNLDREQFERSGGGLYVPQRSGEVVRPLRPKFSRATRLRTRRYASPVGLTSTGVNVWSNAVIPLAPNQLTSATLLAWYRTFNNESIQMATHPEVSGIDLTFSTTGSFVGRGEEITISCTTAGTLGNSKVTVNVNGTNVLTNVSTASSVAIPTTDLSINFPAGNYTTSMVWRSVCDKFLDKVGAYPSSTNNFTNATVGTNRPYIKRGTLGGSCLKFDAANDVMVNAGPLAAAMFGGADQPFYLAMLVNITSNPGGGTARTLFCASNLTDTDLPRVELLVDGTVSPQKWRINRVSDAGVSHGINSVIPANTGAFLLEYGFDGTNARLSANSGDVIGGQNPDVGGAQSGATITPTQIALCARQVQTGTSNFAAAEVYEICCFDRPPTDPVERFRLERYFNG